MTDEEWWLTCDKPREMLEFLGEKAGPRKLRLFACACCRRSWHLLPDEWSRRAVEVAEQFADRQIGEEARVAAASQAMEVSSAWGRKLGACVVRDGAGGLSLTGDKATFGPLWAASQAACYAAYYLDEAALECATDAAEHASDALCDDSAARWNTVTSEDRAQSDLVRCIFGNPFGPVKANPAWLTEEVIRLAQQVYDARSIERMPELIELLRKSGCTEKSILAHGIQDKTHARGCWLLDLVLGKEG